MRKKHPVGGQRRLRSRFLLLPKTLECGGRRETRWLERATWLEEYVEPFNAFGKAGWKACHWVAQGGVS